MNLSKQKNYLFCAAEELKAVSAVLQKNNSLITDDNKLLSFTRYPFMTGVNLSNEVKEHIRKKMSEKTRDTGSLLLSLVSVVSTSTNMRHHILSVELFKEEVGSFYVNYDFLLNYLKFGRYTLNSLTSTSNLDKVIHEMISDIKNRTSVSMGGYESVMSNSATGLELSINKLRSVIASAYSGHFRVDDDYYLFNTDNIRFKFSSDYMNVDNHYYSGSKLLYNFYQAVDDRENNKLKDQNVLIQYQPRNLFSKAQEQAFSTMSKAVNVVIGAGGSGKTFMAKIVAERALELNAILLSHLSAENVENKNIAPLLYTTYSKGSLEQFLRYCTNGEIMGRHNFTSLIYRRSVNVLEDRAGHLNEGFDMNRFKRIEEELRGISINQLHHNLNEQMDYIKDVSTYLEYCFMAKDLPVVEKYEEDVRKKQVPIGFWEEIKIKLGISPEPTIKVNQSIVSELFNTGKFFPSEFPSKNVSKVIDIIENRYKRNHSLAEKKFADLYAKSNSTAPTPAGFSGIDYLNSKIQMEDIIFYLKYYPAVQNTNKQQLYKQLINEMKEAIRSNKAINFYKKVQLSNGKTSQQPDLQKISLFTELFPLSADLVTNVTDLDIFFDKIIADEAVLIPGIFTTILMSKTNNLIAMGDINQLELELNLQSDLADKLRGIYSSNEITSYPLSISETSSKQLSLFSHAKRFIDENYSLKVLVDNYRCRREIFKMSQLIQDKYNEYITKYKAINNITGENFIKFFNEDINIYRYGDTDEISSPFLFINNGSRRYEHIEKIIDDNGVDVENVFIIVPYKDQIATVKSMLKNKEIVVDTLENLQGRDAEIVVYDSFIDSSMDENYKALTMQKFNLIITRARNLFIFMGSRKICYDIDLKDRQDEPSLIIQRFFREKHDEIFINELSIDIEEE